jgi:hypothetical protein
MSESCRLQSAICLNELSEVPRNGHNYRNRSEKGDGLNPRTNDCCQCTELGNGEGQQHDKRADRKEVLQRGITPGKSGSALDSGSSC